MKKDDLSGCAILCFLIVGIAGVMAAWCSVVIFSVFLPLWVAVLVGLPVGAMVFVLSILPETTALERAIRCLIWIVLISIIIPVIDRAKQNGQRVRMQRIQQRQNGQNRPGIEIPAK